MTLTTTALFTADGDGFVSRGVPELFLSFDGIRGDRHAGRTRESDARTPWHGRGKDIANTRQVSLLSVEELAEIAAALGLGALEAHWVGANVLVEGMAGFTQLPSASRLMWPSGATLFVTEPNAPCRHAGAAVAKAHGRPGIELEFAKVAKGKRGLVALVEREGAIHAGEAIRIVPPGRG
ncbi:MAG: MOSC domain-containing protein [Hyphomicrobiaceae bacterium]|nr:MOSC domain-containing protein [Hyphomicrobiaceae bacterium]